MTLDLGQPAPDFTLPTDGSGTVSLSALKGKKVIVYFYPKDDTPGCTKEACGFRDALPDFTGADATVIGISKDSASAHDKFKAKYELSFILASDTEGTVTESFGSWVEKLNYGKRYMGIERSTFLIDRDGVVRGLWRKVKVDGHVEKVLAAAKALP
jgi:peroxiredoxin Q/BCP